MKLRKCIQIETAMGSEVNVRELRDANGRTVLQAGAVLTAANIEMLKKRGIRSALVITEEEISEQALFNKQQMCSDELEKKFARFLQDETMQGLKGVLLQHCQEKMGLREGE